MFGLDEDIRMLQEVKLKGADNEDLFIGHKVTTRFFVAGVYTLDEGYVLGIVSEPTRYYQFPEGEALVEFRKDGLLPQELPIYNLSTWDYIFGYSLWLLIPFVYVWTVLEKKFKTKPDETLEETENSETDLVRNESNDEKLVIDNIDFSKYSRSELHDCLEQIDKDKYPERVKVINLAIQQFSY